MRHGKAPAGVRLEVNLPRNLSEASRSAVLAAIADADAYGHRRTGESDCLWALVIHEAEENPGDR